MSPDQAGLVQSTMRAENGRSSFTTVRLRLHFIIATRNWLRLGLERWFWEMWRHVRNSSPFCVAAFLRTPQQHIRSLQVPVSLPLNVSPACGRGVALFALGAQGEGLG